MKWVLRIWIINVDQVSNARGQELLDVCKLNDVLILNGRTVGDAFGSCTSHQWNGSSVVDYALLPNNFTKNISTFTVGDYVPWLSDHCPIHTDILFNDWKHKNDSNNNSEMTNLPPGFMWDENSKKSFSDGLKSAEMKERIRNLEQCDEKQQQVLLLKLNSSSCVMPKLQIANKTNMGKRATISTIVW